MTDKQWHRQPNAPVVSALVQGCMSSRIPIPFTGAATASFFSFIPNPPKRSSPSSIRHHTFHVATSMLPRWIRSMIQTGSMTSAKSSSSSDGVPVEHYWTSDAPSAGFLRWQKSMASRSRESRSASMPPNRRAPDCTSRLPIATSTQPNSRPKATM